MKLFTETLKEMLPSKKPTVWSNGGGTQSAAIAALIVRGDLPPPDLCVIADTGREVSSTWQYMDTIISPALATVGVAIHRIPHDFQPGPDSINKVDLFSGKSRDTIVMPMYSSKPTTGRREGILKKYCSNEWKTRPIQRFCRAHDIRRADLWIGFTIDELERCRVYDNAAAWNHAYPLIDRRMSRGDCIALVESMRWPTPPRSACWMCPLRNNHEWRDLKNNQPEDFAKAVALERYLQRHDPDVYFHNTVKPLTDVDLTDEPDLFAKPCSSGMCFT